jgi:hypothetical protein
VVDSVVWVRRSGEKRTAQVPQASTELLENDVGSSQAQQNQPRNKGPLGFFCSTIAEEQVAQLQFALDEGLCAASSGGIVIPEGDMRCPRAQSAICPMPATLGPIIVLWRRSWAVGGIAWRVREHGETEIDRR